MIEYGEKEAKPASRYNGFYFLIILIGILLMVIVYLYFENDGIEARL